jgi:hypothetical protein
MPTWRALGKFALASVYRAENKDTQAVDLYKQLIDKPTLVVSKATRSSNSPGSTSRGRSQTKPRRSTTRWQKENPSTEAASLAQRRAAALK